MPLAGGTRLGSFEIVALIGAGGMGEVYRARDIKLNRDVAIKILPDAFAQDAGRMARFSREAQMVAALNHPNIAHIYGVEDRALVMELVEGKTLKGPLPVETALRYAKQIAEALEAAHEKGIIHRDLKPANIMIATSGILKVLDFGLAKAADAPTPSDDPTNSPTVTMSPTRAGVIMGTAAYMSPEQARGKPVDRRSDIWSLGAVMYEMLTGKRAFAGETVTDILAAIVKDQPPLDHIPPRVRTIVDRCLRKDPRQRWQAIGDVRLEIEELLANPGAISEAVQRGAARPLWKRAIPIAAAVMVTAAIAGLAVWYFKPSPALPAVRFTIALGEGQAFSNPRRRLVAISRDGTQMIYVADTRLYLRSLTDPDVRVIPGSERERGVANPVFAPDGRSVAFWDQEDMALKRIPVTGGPAVTICPATSPSGMSWDSSGIIYGQNRLGVMRVSPNGGKPEQLATVQGTEVAAHPEILPGGQALMFAIQPDNRRWEQARIVVQNLKTGQRKTLIDGGNAARYVPTGHLVYAVGGTLFSVPFNPRRLEITGSSVPAVEGVMRSDFTGTPHFAFSSNGTLLYIPGPGALTPGQSFVLIDKKGGVEPLKIPPAAFEYPRVSPDGKRLAYGTDDGKEAAIWIYDLGGASAPRRLTFQGGNRFPVWSGDGERVAFQSDREGDLGIFWQRADGTGTAERLTKPEEGFRHVPDSFSPDGRYLSFTARRNGKFTVWTLSLTRRKATVAAEGPFSGALASSFSPDGRWMVYMTDDGGASGFIYVQPFPPNGTKYQIAQGLQPSWLKNGKEIVFIPGAPAFAAVTVSTERGFSFSSPSALQRADLILRAPGGPRNYDFLADGRMVGVSRYEGGQVQVTTPQIQVVLNWFEDLKQRVPLR
jgi:serine/threonine-protein kinase